MGAEWNWNVAAAAAECARIPSHHIISARPSVGGPFSMRLIDLNAAAETIHNTFRIINDVRVIFAG